MSLATRCPACSTVFRVVQDQLRVSEGWVRCGQCQEVFNALETLFDLGPLGAPADEPSAPAPGADAQPEEFIVEPVAPATPADEWAYQATAPAAMWNTPPAAPEGLSSEADAVGALAARPDRQDPVAGSPGTWAAPAGSAEAPAPRPDVGVAPESEAPDATATAQAPLADETLEPTPSRFMGPVPDWSRKTARGRRKAKPAAPAAAAHGEAHAHVNRGARRRRRQPEFVRQAEQAAFWRRPWVRAGLASASALLVAGLGLQIAYEYRDPLAAQVPALAPHLQAACAQLGCRIAAPRALERIRLDSSDLTRTEREQVLRFTAELHNTANHAVRMPALDVTFTDTIGQVVSRKVMLPDALGAHSDAIDADGLWRVDARLAVGDLQIAGYTVEVFYP